MSDIEAVSLENARIPGLIRRLAALFYDTCMLAAVIIVAAGVVVLPYESISGNELPPENIFYQIYLLGVWSAFFCGFWVHGGQTIGMRAWRIRVIRNDGEPLRWRDALLRFFAAGLSWLPLGLGYLWSLWEPEKRSWHDMLSGTRLVVLKKTERNTEHS